jgi:glycosyltransferase involved in cell wall biosynthesis
MATRNGERYIRRQLESILTQLKPDDELVISDDSSTDGTIGIIKSFRDPRIRLFEGNAFFNPIFNFEHAIRQATGNVIVLSDQDDIWLENKAAVIREKFEGKLDAVHTVVLDGCIIDERENVISGSLFRHMKAGRGILKNIYDNTYKGCCMAFTRSLLRYALPFPKGIPMHDMWLGLLSELFGTVDFVEVTTMKHRRHANNVSSIYLRLDVPRQVKRRILLAYFLLRRFFEGKRKS